MIKEQCHHTYSTMQLYTHTIADDVTQQEHLPQGEVTAVIRNIVNSPKKGKWKIGDKNGRNKNTNCNSCLNLSNPNAQQLMQRD